MKNIYSSLYSSFLLWMVSMVTCQTPDTPLTQINFKITEELETGTPIGNIAAESGLGTGNGYNFQIVKDDYSIVFLNKTTGELTTAKVIDRETICKNQKTCDIQYEVLTNKDADIFSITVTLKIIDINDNTPTFDPSKMVLNLSESTPEDKSYPLKSAIDLDTGDNNGITSYRFSPFSTPNESFEILINNDNSNNLGLSLKLIKTLDREKQNKFQLLILAEDSGTPIRTGTLTVDINVIDENDNKPKFDNAILNITVTEDIAIGKGIVTLRAEDADFGKNGKVAYALAGQQENYILEHFAIDEISGQLSVAQKLEYEPNNAHKTIYIVASDQGSTPQSATATVYLTIEDIGNTAPKISLIFWATKISENVIQVSENSKKNTAIVSVNVEDTDSGENGQVSCNLYNTYFGLESVSNSRNSYKVFVQHTLDRESIVEHNVTVWCEDGGGLKSEVAFLVKIKDENDNSPIFSTYVYQKSFEENNTYGAEILTVSAFDKDDPEENGRISYFIHPDNTKEFEAEENTGVIRAKVKLDREASAEKIFEVIAVDHGKPPRSSTATVRLDLIDINDMRPEFTQPELYEFRVKEGMESNTQVDQVTATDGDQGNNGKVVYYLPDKYKTGGIYAVPFDVLENGEIKTNMELDRENKSIYNFEVGVKDFGIPSLNNTVRVVVKVDDINDNVPEFIFPSAENNSIIAYNEVSDTAISTLNAKDKDVGINQKLVYFILEGNNEGIFSLDPNSGKLFIVKYIHLTEDKVYPLSVSVYDKGQPQLSVKENLSVTLRYTNVTHKASTGDGASKSYVIIVVTVVCITCLLSVTIITVICLIRRKDIHKCGKSDTLSKVRIPTLRSTKPSAPPQQLGNDKIYPEAVQSKNKKEVSFSFEDGDSFSSSDNKVMTAKEKGPFPSRPSPLNDMPEEMEDATNGQHSILRTQQYSQLSSQAKYLDHTDGSLNVSHQREDSHSETSGETATSHDSGKGGSVEGDNHDVQLHIETLNPSAYLIRQDGRPTHGSYRHPKPSSPVKNIPPSTLPLPYKNTDLKPKSAFNDNNFHITHPSHRNSQNRNRCPQLDSTGSYPDSDYISLSSNHNYSQGNINPYRDSKYNYSSHNINQLQPPIQNRGYYNQGYGHYPTYRSNSTRDDDDTTTTSGSYTINHEDLDDDIAAAQYQVSQVV
ncbi:protocadherin alpha-11-like isoform X2 [Mercenaria mercenaria]|uniref:protocadherin alpha-11-like isoform X2 n=1 Tax=Mercenaria mercenaria TaxID=6596 RepID=UPI00234E597F|nr:protocadherin alpha-11-like isoform X2 [Mercenaria mercenaria]